MKKNRGRVFATVLVLAALASCGGPDESADPADNPREQPVTQSKTSSKPPQAPDFTKINLLEGLERRTLDNGLVVLVKEDRRLPTVSTVLTYRVGSVHERDGNTGLAHFLEHMMFKGTDKFRKGEIDWRTFLAGGMNNAYTSEDMTSYWFTVSSDTLDEFLALEANRMRHCTLDPKEFESERNVVIEELRRMLDGPWGKLQYEIDQKVFKSHSYRHPVIGFLEDLEKMTYEEMAGFYRAYYGPNNATLVVVGDCDKERTFAKAKELFGPIAKVETPKVPVPAEPPQKEENRFDIKTDHEVGRLGLAFRSAKVGSEEDYVLDLISMILAPGPDSRLHKRLVDRERLATGVEASNNTRKFDGIFYIFAELCPKKGLAEAEKAVLDELEKLAKTPVPERELQKVKNLRTAQFVYEKEEQLSVADGIAHFEAYGVPDYLKTYLAKINAVTPATVRKVAASLFRRENRTTAHATAATRRFCGGPGKAAQGQPAPVPDFGEYFETRLPNGLTLLVKPKRDLPVVSIHAYVNAEARFEPEDKAGVAQLTGRLLDQGCLRSDGTIHTAEEIAEEVAFIGGQLSTSATGAGLKILSHHQDFAWDLLRDVLTQPSFPKERVEQKRDEQLAEIAQTQDSPTEVARLMFREQIYAGLPMGRPEFGSEATVQKLTRDDVAAHHRRFFRPENTIIAVAGDVSPATVMEEVKKRFASWQGQGEFTLPPVPAVPRVAGTIATKFRKDAQQLNYFFGHLSVDRADPDWYALRVLEYVFCRGPGFTDRLSKTVRDEMGLCYSITGDLTSGADEVPGPFYIYVGTGADNGTKAYDKAVELMKELIEKGPTDEETEAAKSYVLRSFVGRWGTSDSLASYMIMIRRLNLGIDYSLKFRRAVSGVTRETLHRAARAHLHPEALVTVVVGPVDKEGKVQQGGEDK